MPTIWYQAKLSHSSGLHTGLHTGLLTDCIFVVIAISGLMDAQIMTHVLTLPEADMA